ncbi:DUF5789 family protein [Halorussus ruber]|uniref:DUF5789 family protein n=1 Tax=Halorussus ruber TaxID=1126238 RepID=UPI001091AC4D|nr:hypothetical protein [Halorussus ruber]
MSESGDDSREMGLELGDLKADLEDADYPLDAEELMEQYGDYEIGLPDGEESFREVMVTGGDETFESADEVEQAILNRVSAEAVGRQGYSDRGAGNEGENTDESF